MTNLSNFILEKISALIVVIDPNGEISYINSSVQNILGYQPQQLIGTTWSTNLKLSNSYLHDAKNATLELLKDKKYKNINSSFASEQIIFDTFGRERCVLWNLSLGPENQLVGIGQDITDIKSKEKLLLSQNTLLIEKNKDILDSIKYSQRIQKAILPDLNRINRAFDEAFVLFKPKDIVSGDFYWFHEQNSKIFLASIDCTGHGVPGALMTVLANSLLRNIMRQGIENPSEILNLLDQFLFEELNNNGSEQTPDGMDISLCVFDLVNNKLQFSGAFRPLVLIRNQEFIEFKGARYPIGFYNDIVKKFQTTEIDIKKGDSFYLFSDGYVDQFGGQKMKKFNKKSFRNLLLEVQDFSMEEQEGYLEYAHNNWKQNLEQVDDICVIGVKI